MYKDKQILAIVLARRGSARLKNKHLLMINNKPIIKYTMDYIKKSNYVDEVVCSTNDENVIEYLSNINVSSIKRPDKLAGDNSPIIHALRYTLEQLKIEKDFCPDAVVILYGNVPFRRTPIDKGLELFFSKNADSVFTASEVRRTHPYWTFSIENNCKLNYLFPKEFDKYRHQDLPEYYISTGAYYITDPTIISENRPNTHLYSDFGDNIYMLREEENSTIEVDETSDLIYAEFISQNQEKLGYI